MRSSVGDDHVIHATVEFDAGHLSAASPATRFTVTLDLKTLRNMYHRAACSLGGKAQDAGGALVVRVKR